MINFNTWLEYIFFTKYGFFTMQKLCLIKQFPQPAVKWMSQRKRFMKDSFHLSIQSSNLNASAKE